MKKCKLVLLATLATVFVAKSYSSNASANALFKQVGAKMAGVGCDSLTEFGNAVALSTDGSTAVIGGYGNNNDSGGVFVFTKVVTNQDTSWVQQGNKIRGTGAVGNARQGNAVAISGDGNTLVFGGYQDSLQNGAIWVFTRSNGVWTQQGPKLVGTGDSGVANQGYSVAISADGNTIVEGGFADNNNIGAIWVFTRSNGVWTQQGQKLVGTGYQYYNAVAQGNAVSISADGNTIAEGGDVDNKQIGAVWIFVRKNGSWSQQGDKIVASDYVGQPLQGQSVALSGDGNTLAIGGPTDSSSYGAVWIFTQKNNTWTQQTKLKGSGGIKRSLQGYAVSLSANGSVLVEGGFGDNSGVGAAWIFALNNGNWSQQGQKLMGANEVGNGNMGEAVAISADGTTVLVGGDLDSAKFGAAWIYQNISTTSGIASVKYDAPTFSVYPNPITSGESLTVAFQAEMRATAGVIAIYDITGNEVKQAIIDNTATNVSIPVNDLPGGLYIVSVKTQQGICQTSKMIISK